MRAAAQEKSGIAKLSGERIAKEMLRLLEAANPVPALRLIAAAGILEEVLPGASNIVRLERLAEIDAANFFTPDAMLRLAALLPPDKAVADRIADRWKLSNEARARLADIAGASERIVSYSSMRETRKLLYRLGAGPFRDRLFLKWAQDTKASMQWRALLAMADAWQPPRFPLSGRDVMLAGVQEGPLVGKILAEVEEWWVDSDFTEDEFSLAERLKAVVQAVAY